MEGQRMPPQMQIQIFRLLATYLLYERRQQTELAEAFVIMAQERHNEFHGPARDRKVTDSSFADCKNEVCRGAQAVLSRTRSSEITMDRLSVELTNQWALLCQILPDQPLKAWIVGREEAQKMIKQEESQIVPATEMPSFRPQGDLGRVRLR